MLGSVPQRLLCIPVQRTYACKTRREGKGHWGPHMAIKRVQAEPDVARSGGALDVHEPRRRGWGLCTPLLVLPPCRGETASLNAHPMPCQAAPPRAYRAIA